MAEPRSKDDKMTTLFLQGRKFFISKEKLALFTRNPDPKPISLSDGKSVKIGKIYVCKEEFLFDYRKANSSFLQGDYPNLVLKNRLQEMTNSNTTIATYTCSSSGSNQEITSRNVAKLIGQNNYNLIFSALRSVINQELKLRAMLALLMHDKKFRHTSCQTNISNDDSEENKTKLKTFKDSSCQTDSACQKDDSTPDFGLKRPRLRRKITPYVVKENPIQSKPYVKRTIINPFIKEDRKKIFAEEKKKQPSIPDIHLDEDSNSSMTSNITFTNMSVCSEILNDEMQKMLYTTDHTIKECQPESNTIKEEPDSNIIPLQQTDTKVLVQQTDARVPLQNVLEYNQHIIVAWDGTKVMVPCKPEDQFHLATPQILKHVTHAERKKLLWHQAFIDWKLCLETDENDNMPLHLAVMSSDVDLIGRQCLVLKTRGISIDVKANGMTALEIAIRQNSSAECTSTLVELGADPLHVYSERQTALHLAAQAKGGHLRALVEGLRKRAREILTEHDELHFWNWQNKSDDQLATHLLLQSSFMFDNQGYSPLMLAAKVGNPDNVKALLEKTPETVNTAMPNTGNTALYIAVSEACMHAVDIGLRAQVADNYLKTVETLLECGADPEIENSSGTKIGDLLQEFNITSLSMLVANKVTEIHFPTVRPGCYNADAYMLVKNKEGDITLVENIAKERQKKKKRGKKDKTKVILPEENISVTEDKKNESSVPVEDDKKNKTGTSIEDDNTDEKYSHVSQSYKEQSLETKGKNKRMGEMKLELQDMTDVDVLNVDSSVKVNTDGEVKETSVKVLEEKEMDSKALFGLRSRSGSKISVYNVAATASPSVVVDGSMNVDKSNENAEKSKLKMTSKIVDYASNIVIKNLTKAPFTKLNMVNTKSNNNKKLVKIAPRPMIEIVKAGANSTNVKIQPKVEGTVKIVPQLASVIIAPLDSNVTMAPAVGPIVITPILDGSVKIIPKVDGYVKIATKRKVSLTELTESSANDSKKQKNRTD